MAQNLISKAKAYSFDEDYQRIVDGKRINILNRPYTTEYIQQMIDYYEEEEHYEKCQKLILILRQINSHDYHYNK